MNVLTPGLQFYVDKIIAREPFSFVRYGDGEWAAAILQNKAQNCDHTSLKLPGLVEDLRNSLMRPHLVDNYIMSLRPASATQKPQIGQWLRQNSLGVKWHDCRVFVHASIKGQLNPFIRALRNLNSLNMPLVFIGPRHIQHMRLIFSEARHIIVGDTNCHNQKESILAQILNIKVPAFFSFSAGPATKGFIHQLYPDVGKHSFLIDLGSLWSVYCGTKIRTYHKTIAPETLERNLR